MTESTKLDQLLATRTTRLDDILWNKLISQVSLRLGALDKKMSMFDGTQDAIVTLALEQINAQVAALVAAMEERADNSTTLLQQVSASIDELSVQMEALLSSGSLPAASVSVAEIDGIAGTTAQAVLAEIAAQIAALDATFYTRQQTDTAIADAIAGLIGGAPGALDTLNELAAALNDDEAFATSVMTALAAKAPAARAVGTGSGLTGGGDLSADRTISADIADQAAIDAGTAGKLVDAEMFAANQAGGGAWELISSTELVSDASSVEFTVDATPYTELKLVLNKFTPSTDQKSLIIQFSPNGGTTYRNTHSVSIGPYSLTDTASDIDLVIQPSNSIISAYNDDKINVDISIYNMGDATYTRGEYTGFHYVFVSASMVKGFFISDRANKEVHNHFKLYYSGANIQAGATAHLYGLRAA